MRHELPRLGPAHRQVYAVHDVVEAAFQQLQERLTGLSRDARGLPEVVLELRFEDAVIAAHLLLLAQLTAVFANLLTARLALRFLTRCGAAPFDGTLFR